MSKFFLSMFCIVFSIVFGAPAVAQSYDFQQGYVFDQSYIQRVSVNQAEKIANVQGLFTPLLKFEWLKEREMIKDSRVKRSGSRLVLQFGGKARLSLKNFSTKQGDGEYQLFKYLRSVPGFHVVGVEYGHDQPQFLLIPESGGQIYFVNTNELVR